MTPEQRQRLEAALEAEHVYLCKHGDGVRTCDITKAFEEWLYLWAAHFLIGATDEGIKETEAVYQEINPSQEELDEEREELLKAKHVACPHCNAVNWLDDHKDQTTCGDCGRSLLRTFYVTVTERFEVKALDGEAAHEKVSDGDSPGEKSWEATEDPP